MFEKRIRHGLVREEQFPESPCASIQLPGIQLEPDNSGFLDHLIDLINAPRGIERIGQTAKDVEALGADQPLHLDGNLQRAPFTDCHSPKAAADDMVDPDVSLTFIEDR